MKNILLTTTALTLVGGFAAAEVTFSGKGEAGVYRTAPTAAVAAVAGQNVGDSVTDNTSDASGGLDYNSAGVLTFTSATATGQTATNAYGAAPTTAEIDLKKLAIATAYQNAAKHASDAAAHALLTAGSTQLAAYVADKNAETADLAAAAKLEAQLAVMQGSAAVAKGKAPEMVAYSGYDLDVAVSAAADNGMTFSMGFDMGAGLIADQDDDRAMDAQAGAIATSAMTIGYEGYTIRIGDDKLDDLYDDTQNGDVGISGSFGDLSFSLVTDMDDDVKAVAAKTTYTQQDGDVDMADLDTLVVTGATAAVYNPTSYSIGYTMGAVAFSMAGTEHDDRGHAAAKMSLTYTLSDALSATVSSDNVGTYKDIGKLSATYKLSDGMSITASVKDDKDHALNTNTGGKQSQDVSLAYSAGSLAATLATDESSNWWVNAQYDLGGGAQAFTTFDHSEFLVAGVNFKF